MITVDGSSGEVYEGAIAGTGEIVPEAGVLLSWARELGIPVGTEAVGTAPPPAPDVTRTVTRTVTPDRCLRALSIKGFAALDGLADAVLASPDDVRPIVDRLTADGLVTTVAGANRLTVAGTARAAALLETERTAWRPDGAALALDAFVELDGRMKTTVSAWQVRDDADGQVVNDHGDVAYDRGVLDRLAGLHAEALAWLTPLEAACPRLADYRARLGRALERSLAGDQRYVASPRVDSYHSIWFELHEDLIRLAGRSRAEEVEAGRA
jgi:pyruvate,orthophosphate dikinase